MLKRIPLELIYLCIILISCSFQNERRDIRLKVLPFFRNTPMVLEEQKYLTDTGDTVLFTTFKFYLSAIEVQMENGNVYKEKNSFHLLEQAGDSFPEIVLKKAPSGKIKSISFLIGIDSASSVSGALDGDLDPAKGMYWAWNSGYINAKLEGISPSCSTRHHKFEYHIGGYLPQERAVRKVVLPVSSESSCLRIKADVSKWLMAIPLAEKPAIMTPGKEAMKIADRYVSMFELMPY